MRIVLKLVLTLGTRPEAIKLAPLAVELRRRAGVHVVIVSTGQHRDLVGDALGVFGLQADVDLGLMRENQQPAELLARITLALAPIVRELNPDWMVVQGDTTSTLAGALTAHHLRIPVAHVEAGLRSGCSQSPWPEEANRRMVDHMASLLFAPTDVCRVNLIGEGIPTARIFLTGNSGVDAGLHVASLPSPAVNPVLARLGGRPLVLVTSHRRESLGETLRKMFRAIATVAAAHPEIAFLWVLHPNPRARSAILDELRAAPHVAVSEPLEYPAMIHLLRRARLVITDSGGLVEEAPSFGVPVLIIRDRTERAEILDAGGGVLAGTEPEAITRTLDGLLRHPRRLQAMRVPMNPFGDGCAAQRIADALTTPLQRCA